MQGKATPAALANKVANLCSTVSQKGFRDVDLRTGDPLNGTHRARDAAGRLGNDRRKGFLQERW